MCPFNGNKSVRKGRSNQFLTVAKVFATSFATVNLFNDLTSSQFNR